MAKTARQTFDAKLEKFKTIRSERELQAYVVSLLKSNNDKITHIWQVSENMVVSSIKTVLDESDIDYITSMMTTYGGINALISDIRKKAEYVLEYRELTDCGAIIINKFGKCFNDNPIGVDDFIDEIKEVFNIVPSTWKIICVSIEDYGLDGIWSNECTDWFNNISYWPQSGRNTAEDDDLDESLLESSCVEFDVVYGDFENSNEYRVSIITDLIEQECAEGNATKNYIIVVDKDGACIGDESEFDADSVYGALRLADVLDFDAFYDNDEVNIDSGKISEYINEIFEN